MTGERPCACGRFVPGEPYLPGRDCARCWMFAHRPEVRAAWGADPAECVPLRPLRPIGPPGRRPLPCRHEGPVVGTPDAHDPDPTRLCAVHGRCTRQFTWTGTAACEECADYAPEPAPEPSVRHLLYHVYPRRGSDWRTRLLRIRERIDLFNGLRVVAVATDATTEHAVMAADALDGTGCEVVELPNDSERREVASFPLLFGRAAAHTAPGHVTLFAHAKGVTRPAASTAGRWVAAFEELYLDYWPAVAELLRRFPVAGAFKKLGTGWPPEDSLSDWHYSGSWFWFRNADLFARDWTRIDPYWGGIESYTSLHFAPHEAANLACGGVVPTLNLYDPGFWATTVEPALAAFRAANAGRRTGRVAPPGRWLNLGCGPHRAAGWVNADVVETATIRPDVLVPGSGPLPFADAAFDRCYLGHVLEHVPWAAVPRVLAEVRRVVRPGGEVMVVGPDFARALDELRAAPDSADALRQVWAIAEERSHYQANEPDFDWEAARHHWNCYERRVAWALEHAGFADVRPLPVEPVPPLTDWPVASYTAAQCAVLARVPDPIAPASIGPDVRTREVS